jgi:hypothetical protein
MNYIQIQKEIFFLNEQNHFYVTQQTYSLRMFPFKINFFQVQFNFFPSSQKSVRECLVM